MSSRDNTTDIIRLDDTSHRGDDVVRETHPSWVLVGISRISHSPPGRMLFDSDVPHQHYVQLRVSVCERERDLNRDWKYAKRRIIEIDMSEQQWGAIISSSGQGDGQPATLSHFDPRDLPTGRIPDAPFQPRLAENFREVREAGEKATEKVKAAHADLLEAFEGGAGKKVMREKLRALDIALGHVPANMEFAVKSLAEAAENVTLKMKGDIEAMAYGAALKGQSLQLEDGMADRVLGITSGGEVEATDVEVIEEDGQ